MVRTGHVDNIVYVDYTPEKRTIIMNLPRVECALAWIRLGARFPVCIQVDDPDESFRLGASAVATVHGIFRSADR